MEIKFKINEKEQGSFYIEQDGRQIAELDFEVKDGFLNAYHTGVRPELEGQGIAGKLFNEMVRYAREKGYKVIPTCSYILARFRRRQDEYVDVWFRTDDEPTGKACGVKPKG